MFGERLGACRTGGSLIAMSDGHKLVCSYLGLVQGPCLGGERDCVCAVWVSPSSLLGTAVCGTVVGGKDSSLLQGTAPAALCTNRTFLFGTRLVTSVMPQIGQHLEK